jgi:hypothetical protein
MPEGNVKRHNLGRIFSPIRKNCITEMTKEEFYETIEKLEKGALTYMLKKEF